MRGSRWTGLWWLLAFVGVGLLLRALVHFPWSETLSALTGANLWLIFGALVLNLLSPVAKGEGWHLLLRRIAPHPWWAAQEANLLGTAVNSIGSGVSGEAARISFLAQKAGVPPRAALVSVAAVRATEGLALGCFVVLAPLLLHLPRAVRGLQAGAAFFGVLVLTGTRQWHGLLARLPSAIGEGVEDLATMTESGRILLPTVLGLASWAVEWGVYHTAIAAVTPHVSPAASFTALIAANLGGLLRLTPANLGIMQAAMVGALLPYGIPAEHALAAGLALQAIQVLPILALTPVVIRLSDIRRLEVFRPASRESSPAS